MYYSLLRKVITGITSGADTDMLALDHPTEIKEVIDHYTCF